MIGLHPTDVTQNYKKELSLLEPYLTMMGLSPLVKLGSIYTTIKPILKNK
jgi:hypothetical protein